MKTKNIVRTALVAAFTAIFVPCASAEAVKPPAKEDKPAGKNEAVKPYKLDTCIVSDEKLGGMGEPFVFTHKGQEIKMCCKMCKPKFDKNPGLYLKKLEAK